MAPGEPQAMVVAGVMSGTSADGVDVAICRISPAAEPGGLPRLELLAHRSTPFDAGTRGAVLAAMDARETSTAALAHLSWHLGEVYTEAVQQAIAASGITPALIALHGQTIYHQASASDFLGAPVRCTWQIGEPAILAERLQLPVVSDFRTADLAAGGQGAPLVPMLDLCLYRHPTHNRVLLNLGGIANLTAIPANCDAASVLAFDTGPANMVVDGCMQQLYGRAFDCGGSTGARGHVLEAVLRELMEDAYLRLPPPKSCGREQYGAPFTDRLIALSKRGGARDADTVATATAFTAETILTACRRFVAPHLQKHAPHADKTEMFVSGGGAHNTTLLRRLREGLAPLRCSVKTTEEAGAASLRVEAKEAAAFALLGWLSWHRLPGNIPAATGANRPIVLGSITPI